MPTVTQIDTPLTATHFDVLIVGAGISGIGAAYHLKTELPAQDVRDPRGPRRDRRHLGPVPLPGHPLRLRPAHLRLRVQALDERQRDRRRRRDPRLPARDGRRERPRAPHPLRPQDRRRRLVASDARAGRVRVERTATGETFELTCRRPLLRRRLLRLRGRLHAALRGPGVVRRRDRAPAAVAGGPRLQRQAGRRDRQRRHRRDPDPGDGRQGRARDDAAALAQLRDDAAGQGPDRQRPAPPARPTASPTASRAA